MRRLSRTLVAFLLFALLLVGGASAMLVSAIRAQDAGDEPPALPPKAVDLTPRGPDELFTALPDVGFEGKVPARQYKAVVLRVPNADSPNDTPDEDLSSNERAIAGGLELMLDQSLEYLPQVYYESNLARVTRYYAMLRRGDTPRVGAEVKLGQKSQSLEAAARTFNADLVFTLSFKPGAGELPARALAARYRRGEGFERAQEWEFGKLGKPEADSVIRLLEANVAELCSGIGAEVGEDGTPVEFPHAPIPRLVSQDKALRDYVGMRDALNTGKLAEALFAYEDVLKRDPGCGRAALFGMEIYRALAETQTDTAEHERYRNRAIEIGREALKCNPDDVLIRGRLCWNAATHYNRFEFAQQGLKQAMKVQPANVELFGWWLTAWSIEDRVKQAEWLIENALPRVNDGRIELILGNLYYGSGDYAKGIEWYRKGVAIAPLEHELQLSLGLCATYEAERLHKKRLRDEALDAWAISVEALAAAQDIDPQEVEYTYEYYVRSGSHAYTWLPSNDDQLERLFLSQAVITGLEPNTRTWQWDRLVKEVITVQKRLLRETVRAARPGEKRYEMKLMARLRFALTDDDNEDLIHTLWLMKEYGLRTNVYTDLMRRFSPIVNEYQPKEEQKDEPEKDG
ncbi:MAG: hypothetical protein H6840_08100 [Planctomycetes bacterium]|nr:hypothetical protein [Planctomycetota bacterium]